MTTTEPAAPATVPPRARLAGPLLPAVTGAAALAAGLVLLTRPSPWWDEAVSRELVTRPIADNVALAGEIDLVHLAWYSLAHVVWLAVGSPESSDRVYLVLRLLSAVAVAGTAALTAVAGRRLASPAVGAAAGALVAASPFASRYAQEARPSAVAALAATAATVVLLRLLVPAPGEPAARWPWWAGYAALVVATGLLNEVALLVLAGHAVLVAVLGRRRAWLAAAVVSLVLLAPFVRATLGQSGQVDWLRRPGPVELAAFAAMPWGLVGAGVAAVAVLAGLAALRRGPAPDGVPRAVVAGLALGVLPPALLWAGSQVEPAFAPRYLVFALPGLALLVAAAGAALRGAWPAALVVALAVTGIPSQVAIRADDGHREDLRGAAAALAAAAEPGDGVLFLPGNRRILRTAYPERFAGLDDLAAVRDAPPERGHSAPDVPAGGELARRAAGLDRIWLVTGGTGHTSRERPVDAEKERLLEEGFARDRVVEQRDYTFTLYVRRG